MLGLYLSMLNTEEQKTKFEQIYLSYRSIAYNYAKKILRDSYLAEDAVHEMFLILAKNMNKIENRTEKEIKNYIIIIVKNVAIKIYNDRKNIVCVDDPPVREDDFIDVELKAEKHITSEHILKTIKSMDEKYGDVIILKYFYDMKEKEIANVLGITLYNVKIRLYRGMKMLSERITEDDHDKNKV